MKWRYVCENCGKVMIYSNPEEGFADGWDYPPKMGEFTVISPRTCGDCGIETSLWWAFITGEVTSVDDLSSKQKVILNRIIGEPESIMVKNQEFSINKIQDNSPIGEYFFRTLSGSSYIVTIEINGDKWIQRFNDNGSLRRDNEKIHLQKIIRLEIGKSAKLILEPLGVGNETLRVTTPVIEIYQ